MMLGGRTLSLETGRMARQAGGSVLAMYGETAVLVAATASKVEDTTRDYFPLQVEYREKSYAGGKIPGGFFKREARPSEKEILSARMTDRPIRPLFPETFNNETQVIITVLSSDGENTADTLGTIGASFALSISDIPWNGPVASVHVGRIDGELILNPTYAQLEESEMDITITGTATDVVMVEGEAKEVSEEVMVEALVFAQKAISEVVAFQQTIIDEIKPVKREIIVDTSKDELKAAVEAAIDEKELTKLNSITLKLERQDARNEAKDALIAKFEEAYPDDLKLVGEVFSNRLKANIREQIMAKGKRVDGRGLKDIRQITAEVGVLPRVHGSALFTRGETQALVVATLGTKLDEQIMDGIDHDYKKPFYLHYNFPPYCVGETGRIGFTSRREIGHGNLAERSLRPFLPEKEDFPYTVRLVSEILESNGSSSMASVCGGSLALMDAGVGINKTVAGIAMGLISDGKRFSVLSDILGDEDHYGDMDFKVTGTKDGINAIQMDLKIEGISAELMTEALHQAREGRHHIIDIMEASLPAAREDISPNAPRFITIKIKQDQIGDVIGPGGKIIKAIQADTGATVEIEQEGVVFIFADNTESAEAAAAMVNAIVRVPVAGEEFDAEVVRIMNFGAFVEFLPGKQGLIHISDLEWGRVEKVEDVLNIGDTVRVKLTEVDDSGRYNLSRKALLEKPEGYVEPERKPRPPRKDNRGGRGGGGRGPRRDNRR
ncbi:MAG: polyribonucleotide nucleotidyltransferase [Candidatus Marinimicrobia bacterium]|nr:polyribonucleotide nucleotidyltransferase [Candidatus Neomarinimicrobiota bacterium]MCF7850654.1 polyribonucleotide nucleotidyltransferase [Candidatus Neomarinimicrobiota bacterium]MCF7905138.1 polyribonucleotide nucleotidyltransferase [Candidatus Neomarinimicrobiota bacterium]